MKVMNPRLVRIAKRLDPFWQLIACLTRPRAKHQLPQEIKSILLVDLHLLGDVVMLTPLLAALRQRHPAARISLLGGPWCRTILMGNSDVDEIIEYVAPWVKPMRFVPALVGFFRTISKLRSRRWDVGIDVRGDVRQILMLYLIGCNSRIGFDFTGGSSLLTQIVPDDGRVHHILDHHERIAQCLDAWRGQEFVPALRLTAEEKIVAERIAPFMGFHFGASLALRRLPLSEAVALLLSYAHSTENFVLFSSPEIEDYNKEVLSLLPPSIVQKIEIWQGNLREFIIKLSRATRMFTMDSGPAHISAALGCPTVVFFGPNLPQNTAPRGQHVLSLENTSLRCRPCDQHRCTNTEYQACMQGLVCAWLRNPEAGTATASKF